MMLLNFIIFSSPLIQSRFIEHGMWAWQKTWPEQTYHYTTKNYTPSSYSTICTFCSIYIWSDWYIVQQQILVILIRLMKLRWAQWTNIQVTFVSLWWWGLFRSYHRRGNLLRHIAIGNHLRRAENLWLTDLAMTLYHTKLENVENQQLLSPELEKNTFEPQQFTHLSSLIEGWGLPSARSRHVSPRNRNSFSWTSLNDGSFVEFVGNRKQWYLKWRIVLTKKRVNSNCRIRFSSCLNGSIILLHV